MILIDEKVDHQLCYLKIDIPIEFSDSPIKKIFLLNQNYFEDYFNICNIIDYGMQFDALLFKMV